MSAKRFVVIDASECVDDAYPLCAPVELAAAFEFGDKRDGDYRVINSASRRLIPRSILLAVVARRSASARMVAR